MKKLVLFFAALVIGAFLAETAPAAELESVAKAEAVVMVQGAPPSSEDSTAGASGGASTVTGAGGTGRIQIKIGQVINVRGNNPFNPVEPVYNADGQTYDNAAELAQATGGGSGSGSSGGSSSGSSGGSATPVGPSSLTSTSGDGVIFYFDPDNNQYFLGGSGAAQPSGFQEAFDNWTPGSVMDAGKIRVQTNPASDFRIVVPPAGATVYQNNISWNVTPGTHTMTIEEQSTGRRWQVNFTNARSATDQITLTILSVTRV